MSCALSGLGVTKVRPGHNLSFTLDRIIAQCCSFCCIGLGLDCYCAFNAQARDTASGGHRRLVILQVPFSAGAQGAKNIEPEATKIQALTQVKD